MACLRCSPCMVFAKTNGHIAPHTGTPCNTTLAALSAPFGEWPQHVVVVQLAPLAPASRRGVGSSSLTPFNESSQLTNEPPRDNKLFNYWFNWSTLAPNMGGAGAGARIPATSATRPHMADKSQRHNNLQNYSNNLAHLGTKPGNGSTMVTRFVERIFVGLHNAQRDACENESGGPEGNANDPPCAKHCPPVGANNAR